MKQKTLALFFQLITLGLMFTIVAYVLYYVFVGDVANFNMLALWSGGGLILLMLPLFMLLIDYREKDCEEVE